jgi:hypothetical protein
MEKPQLFLALRGAALAELARFVSSVKHRVNAKNAGF